MCTVSMIGDHYRDKWKEYPWWVEPYTSPYTTPFTPNISPPPLAPMIQKITEISRVEFEALKKEVEELKKLLVRAKEYDEKNGEPNCEMDEKVAILRAVAKAVD